MPEPFDQFYSAGRSIARVRAGMIATRFRLLKGSRDDLEQEALLELWQKRHLYDPQRGSWRTFSEQVVANRMTSLVRRMHSKRSGHFREEPLENVLNLAAAPHNSVDLRTDVARVLARMSPFDQAVALCLMDQSITETSERLGVCRATVYGAIARLRAEFTTASLSPRGRAYGSHTERSFARAR